jgi:hypothetical protein
LYSKVSVLRRAWARPKKRRTAIYTADKWRRVFLKVQALAKAAPVIDWKKYARWGE